MFHFENWRPKVMKAIYLICYFICCSSYNGRFIVLSQLLSFYFVIWRYTSSAPLSSSQVFLLNYSCVIMLSLQCIWRIVLPWRRTLLTQQGPAVLSRSSPTVYFMLLHLIIWFSCYKFYVFFLFLVLIQYASLGPASGLNQLGNKFFFRYFSYKMLFLFEFRCLKTIFFLLVSKCICHRYG